MFNFSKCNLLLILIIVHVCIAIRVPIVWSENEDSTEDPNHSTTIENEYIEEDINRYDRPHGIEKTVKFSPNLQEEEQKNFEKPSDEDEKYYKVPATYGGDGETLEYKDDTVKYNIPKIDHSKYYTKDTTDYSEPYVEDIPKEKSPHLESKNKYYLNDGSKYNSPYVNKKNIYGEPHTKDFSVYSQGNPFAEKIQITTPEPRRVMKHKYFNYKPKKPQFAINVAKYHGVPKPEKLFHAYPIKPLTNVRKPVFGRHTISDDTGLRRPIHQIPDSHNNNQEYPGPSINDYEIFHPYKVERPQIFQHYKSPEYKTIKQNVKDNGKRLKTYEKQAGDVKIGKDDYLKSPQQIDDERFGNSPAPHEEYKAARKPLYYNPPQKQYIPNHVLNKKLKYPLPQNSAKIKPEHYEPLRNYLHNFQDQQGMRFSDEKNEYPEIKHDSSNYEAMPDGHDIYEKQKQNFVDAQQNFEGDFDTFVNSNNLQNSKQQKPQIYANYETDDGTTKAAVDDEEGFVPIKMYAQVRKSETTKHLPKSAAYEEAESPEELLDAPRLREAVKSTKAQTVYSEEGYEDSAYDHAGQQKHASNQEGHGGYLKENESSSGKYKIPSFEQSQNDNGESSRGNALAHGKQWMNDDGKSEDHENLEDESSYNQNAEEYNVDKERAEDDDSSYDASEPRATLTMTKDSANTIIKDIIDGTSIKTKNKHITLTNAKTTESQPVDRKSKKMKRAKRGVDFQVPNFSLANTYLTEDEIIKLSKLRLPKKKNNLHTRYPYYFNKGTVNPDSPLRYAENMKHIPIKTHGGTEFYDSRSQIECAEVDEEIDPIPDNIKELSGEENEEDEEKADKVNEENSREEAEINSKRKKRDAQNQPRLSGLGEKIDCFKMKYFGENPLDSPFFFEDLVGASDPIIIPKQISKILLPRNISDQTQANSNEVKVIHNASENSNYLKRAPILVRQNQKNKPNEKGYETSINNKTILHFPGTIGQYLLGLDSQTSLYSDVIDNIRAAITQKNGPTLKYSEKLVLSPDLVNTKQDSDKMESRTQIQNGKTNYVSFNNKEDIKWVPTNIRNRRSTTSFIYEPYKVVKENRDQDQKKMSTSINVSPSIKKLQANNRVLAFSESKNVSPLVKRDVTRKYRNILREDKNSKAPEKNNPSKKDLEDYVQVENDKGDARHVISKQNNHKNQYTPVTIKDSVSVEEYNSGKLSYEKNLPGEDDLESAELPVVPEVISGRIQKKKNNTRKDNDEIKIAIKPYFDINEYIPKIKRPRTIVNSRMRNLNNSHNSDELLLSESAQSETRKPNIIRLKLNVAGEENDSKVIESETESDKEESNYDTQQKTTPKPIRKRKRIKIYRTVKPTTAPETMDENSKEVEDDIVRVTTRPTLNPKRRKIYRKVKKSRKDPGDKPDESVSSADQTSNQRKNTYNKYQDRHEIKVQHHDRPGASQGEDDNEDEKEEFIVSNKKMNNEKYVSKNHEEEKTPQVIEKTSTKSKTTLITNSRQYGSNEEGDDEKLTQQQIDSLLGRHENMKKYIQPDNDSKQSPEVEPSRKQEANAQRIYDEEDIDESEQYNDDEDQSNHDSQKQIGEIHKTNEDEQQNYDVDENDSEDEDSESEVPEGNSHVKEKEIKKNTQPTERPNIPKIKDVKLHRKTPIKEQSRYEENIEEIENVKSSDPKKPHKKDHLSLYRDPDLAKDVNKMAEKSIGVDAGEPITILEVRKPTASRTENQKNKLKNSKFSEKESDDRPYQVNLRVEEEIQHNPRADVEIFEKNLNLKEGPYHGGNYKYLDTTKLPILEKPITSHTNAHVQQERKIDHKKEQNIQTKENYMKNIQPDEYDEEGVEEVEEVEEDDYSDEDEDPQPEMELSENPKIDKDNRPQQSIGYKTVSRGRKENLELAEEHTSRPGHRRRLHGGNLRAHHSVLTDPADILSSIASAMPALSKKPLFIRDPSKRMYYFVDN